MSINGAALLFFIWRRGVKKNRIQPNCQSPQEKLDRLYKIFSDIIQSNLTTKRVNYRMSATLSGNVSHTLSYFWRKLKHDIDTFLS